MLTMTTTARVTGDADAKMRQHEATYCGGSCHGRAWTLSVDDIAMDEKPNVTFVYQVCSMFLIPRIEFIIYLLNDCF